MKYEAPKLSTLMPAINAIQGTAAQAKLHSSIDATQPDVANPAYADWEE